MRLDRQSYQLKLDTTTAELELNLDKERHNWQKNLEIALKEELNAKDRNHSLKENSLKEKVAELEQIIYVQNEKIKRVESESKEYERKKNLEIDENRQIWENKLKTELKSELETLNLKKNLDNKNNEAVCNSLKSRVESLEDYLEKLKHEHSEELGTLKSNQLVI